MSELVNNTTLKKKKLGSSKGRLKANVKERIQANSRDANPALNTLNKIKRNAAKEPLKTALLCALLIYKWPSASLKVLKFGAGSMGLYLIHKNLMSAERTIS